MARLKNWSFKDLEKFLKAYDFKQGHVNGSHFYFNGIISGEGKIVQVINSSKERKSQSDKTMKMAVKHSGIPKRYFEEWKQSKKVHEEIIG